MNSQPVTYQIRVKGHFDRSLAEWFAPLTITNEANGEAILTGPIGEQAALFGMLLKLYNLNFTLLAVQPAPAIPMDLPEGVVQL